MTSKPTIETSRQAYVWVWLPGATVPIPAGLLQASDNQVYFNYGSTYLKHREAVPLYLPELPLHAGRMSPPQDHTIAGCIADASPDAWGQRVVLHKRLGRAGRDIDPGDMGILAYLLESGSDRIGALDFQASPDTYTPRSSGGTLEELLQASDRLQSGEPFSPALDAVLLHGSSIGGARPKALLDDNGRKLIAKFSSLTDTYPVVKAEAVAMDLAGRVALMSPAPRL
jgi:serine/threonine-protein kinase HipA